MGAGVGGSANPCRAQLGLGSRDMASPGGDPHSGPSLTPGSRSLLWKGVSSFPWSHPHGDEGPGQVERQEQTPRDRQMDV